MISDGCNDNCGCYFKDCMKISMGIDLGIDSKKLSFLIKRLRGETSQRQFAVEISKRLGCKISYAAIRQWEAEETLPNEQNLAIFAKLSGKSLQRLRQELKPDPNIKEILENLYSELNTSQQLELASKLLIHAKKAI